jgi:hypothetical protein
MDQKLDKIQEDLTAIKTTLAVNTASLQHHIKRTDLLEQQVNSLPQKVLVFLSIAGGAVALIKNLL